jgi:hypothetical protein
MTIIARSTSLNTPNPETMEPLHLIIVLTGLIEAGLAAALLYRSTEPTPGTHPHVRACSNKFYRSRQHADGTWEIG